ncbi:hypothetical protein GPB2148_1358 [marine gamma proteobacterium HTCC2148]|nr:hypothetical protein GPB2148_1358 [marine gamma proteobacterium HTCC2148]
MQPVVEDFLCLDIYQMLREGVFSRQHSVHHAEGLSIQCEVDAELLHLRYDLDGEDYYGRLSIIRRPRYMGGKEINVLCPDCEHPRWRLRLAWWGFTCRHCLGVPYYKQMAGRFARKLDKHEDLMWEIEKKPMRNKRFTKKYNQVVDIRGELNSMIMRYGDESICYPIPKRLDE